MTERRKTSGCADLVILVVASRFVLDITSRRQQTSAPEQFATRRPVNDDCADDTVSQQTAVKHKQRKVFIDSQVLHKYAIIEWVSRKSNGSF
jgi:hypothetical protein